MLTCHFHPANSLNTVHKTWKQFLLPLQTLYSSCLWHSWVPGLDLSSGFCKWWGVTLPESREGLASWQLKSCGSCANTLTTSQYKPSGVRWSHKGEYFWHTADAEAEVLRTGTIFIAQWITSGNNQTLLWLQFEGQCKMDCYKGGIAGREAVPQRKLQHGS